MPGLFAMWSAATMKVIGLLFFFAFFMIVVLRLVFTRREQYDDMARIPLDDDLGAKPDTTGTAVANHNRG